jgi:type VI secretion system Hcp family effector
MSKRKFLVAVGGAVVACGIGVAVTLAATGGSNTVNACVGPDGVIKLADASGCKKSESPLSWSITGPQGAKGVTGAIGATGAAGAGGAKGATGAQGPAGASGSSTSNPVVGQVAISDSDGAIDGGDGSSPNIDITGFTHAVTAPFDETSGVGVGKVESSPISITKKLDSASPKLYEACVTGEDLTVTVTLYSEGTTTPEMTVKLNHAECASDQFTNGEETVQFAFQQIELQLVNNGSSTAPPPFIGGWNLTQNKSA